VATLADSTYVFAVNRAPRDLLPAVLAGGYLVLAGLVFLALFSFDGTDDFAGWAPVIGGTQVGWCALVGTTQRSSARIGARAGIAAAFAGLFVFACGTSSLIAPIELVELRLGAGGNPVVDVAYFLALGVGLIASILTSVRFARLLAPGNTRGVAAVLAVVALTGLWSLAMGLTIYPLIPQRPWGFFDGFAALLAGATGAGALTFAVPLFVFVWLLSRRPAVDTTSAPL
jgi:hypothetical protein